MVSTRRPGPTVFARGWWSRAALLSVLIMAAALVVDLEWRDPISPAQSRSPYGQFQATDAERGLDELANFAYLVPTLEALPPAPQATPTPVATSQLVELPLDALAPDAAAYLSTREGTVGAAVVAPDRGAIYSANGDELFPMASLAKLVIMLTVMDRATREDGDLTQGEYELLEAAITVSDNDAADVLWRDIGGAKAITAFLQQHGLTGIHPDPDGYWGLSLGTAHDVALLLARLVQGEILDDPMRRTAIDLMGRVEPDQWWGVVAGPWDHATISTTMGVKNGWYPSVDGWWINSAGFFLSAGRQAGYSMVVMTKDQPTFDYGVETIETIAAWVHTALCGCI